MLPMALTALERMKRQGVAEITKPDQWHLVFMLLQDYFYAGKYGMQRRLVRQVENPQSVIDGIIRDSIRSQHPVPLVAFWGVGDKSDFDEADYVGLGALGGFDDFIKARYAPGVHVVEIIADAHGVFNNGSENEPYAAVVEEALSAEPWASPVRLSRLYEAHGLHVPSPNDIQPDTAAYLEQEAVLNAQLIKQAQRHYSGAHPEHGHVLYAQMRLQERDMLEKEFGDRILLVHGSKQNSAALLPETMGKFYLSLEPHWFVKGGEHA